MKENKIKGLTIPLVTEDCILSENMSVESNFEISGDSIEVTPCSSDQDSVMVEVKILQEDEDFFFDSEIFCFLLDCYEENFSKKNCSSELGLGKVDWRDHRLFAYDTGEFKIRQASSREDSIKILDSFIELILGSVFCEKCGRPALDCVRGDCGEGSFETVRVEDYFGGSLRRSCDLLFDVLMDSKNFFQDNNWLSKREGFVEGFRDSVRYALDYCVETPNIQGTRAGLFLIGISRDCLNLIQDIDLVVNGMGDDFNSETEQEIFDVLKICWELNETILYLATGRKGVEFDCFREKISRSLSYISRIDKGTEKELGEGFDRIRTFIKEKESLLERYDCKN